MVISYLHGYLYENWRWCLQYVMVVHLFWIMDYGLWFFAHSSVGIKKMGLVDVFRGVSRNGLCGVLPDGFLLRTMHPKHNHQHQALQPKKNGGLNRNLMIKQPAFFFLFSLTGQLAFRSSS